MKRKRPEDQFRDQIIKVAELNKWRVYHVTDVRKRLRSNTSVGFPDLVLCRPPRLIFAELKAKGGRLTKDQEDWLVKLDRCLGVEIHVWYPKDWDFITETLEV